MTEHRTHSGTRRDGAAAGRAPRTGRGAWIEAALERYEQPLLRYALGFVGDPELARDVVQDAFLRLVRADRRKVEDHLAAWLYTVCRNRALDVARKEGRMGRLSDPGNVADRSERSSPRDRAMLSETHLKVLEAIESLSDEQREAFRLKFQDQLTYREIARVMDRSLGHVSKLLATALREVRDQLRQHTDLFGEVGR